MSDRFKTDADLARATAEEMHMIRNNLEGNGVVFAPDDLLFLAIHMQLALRHQVIPEASRERAVNLVIVTRKYFESLEMPAVCESLDRGWDKDYDVEIGKPFI